MAYVDASSTTRKLGTGAAVLLIEGGLALALIAGLATTITRVPETRLGSYTVPKPPKPLPPPPETRQVRKNPTQIDRPDVLIKLPPLPDTTFPELTEPTGSAGNADLGDVVILPPKPAPTAEPEVPRFKPRAAAPKGKWSQWVTTNDYPANDLRAEHQGTTRYRLAIDARGAVSECTVTSSSGYPGLDRATCANVARRARFEPATDQTGARIAGSFSGSVTWQIPRE